MRARRAEARRLQLWVTIIEERRYNALTFE
jgi:hypothetical protein